MKYLKFNNSLVEVDCIRSIITYSNYVELFCEIPYVNESEYFEDEQETIKRFLELKENLNNKFLKFNTALIPKKDVQVIEYKTEQYNEIISSKEITEKYFFNLFEKTYKKYEYAPPVIKHFLKCNWLTQEFEYKELALKQLELYNKELNGK